MARQVDIRREASGFSCMLLSKPLGLLRMSVTAAAACVFHDFCCCPAAMAGKSSHA